MPSTTCSPTWVWNLLAIVATEKPWTYFVISHAARAATGSATSGAGMRRVTNLGKRTRIASVPAPMTNSQ